MKKLMPKEIEELVEKISQAVRKQYPSYEGCTVDSLLYASIFIPVFTVIEERRAKPGDEEYCGQWLEGRDCKYLIYVSAPWRDDAMTYCGHPDFAGENCPLGRWEVQDEAPDVS